MWARLGQFPQRSEAFLPGPPLWQQLGQLTTVASRCSHDLLSQGYQNPAIKERNRESVEQ